MKVYKFLEQEPKPYGLRMRDWLFIVIFGGTLVFVLKFTEIIGLNLGIYGALGVAALIAISIFLLKKANKESCPNFLDAYISYKLYQPKHIMPDNSLLKKAQPKK